MAVTLAQIKELRTKTGAGIINVKEALDNSGGDMDKAIIYLREKGMAKTAKRAGKAASNGYVASYIHGDGTIGVMLELNAETDFTTRNEKFRELAHEIALHIAAAKPLYISENNIPEAELQQEKEIILKSVDANKPEEIKAKIVDGKLENYFQEIVLLKQKYIRDDSKTIEDLINEVVAAIGEKIEVGNMCRFEIGAGSNFCAS